MSATGWLGILGGGAVTAALALLAWILQRSERALAKSNTAISLTNLNVSVAADHLRLIEALRTAIYLQGNGLDEWENWGAEVKNDWLKMQRELKLHRVITEIHELPTPPKHLDLSTVFSELPKSGPNSADGHGK